MEDETHTAPDESSSSLTPGIAGATWNIAGSYNASRDIIMHGCTTTSNFTFTTAQTVPPNLITFQHFLERFHHSHLSTVYILALCDVDFNEASRDVYNTIQKPLGLGDCTFWINRSTGRLCVELTPPSYITFLGDDLDDVRGMEVIDYLNAPNPEIMISELMTLKAYQNTCAAHWELEADGRCLTASPSTTVKMRAVICCGSSNNLADSVEIASLPGVEASLGDWDLFLLGAVGEVTQDGWTRFPSNDVVDTSITIGDTVPRVETCRIWLSQANHIFSCIRFTSNVEDLDLVHSVHFELKLSATEEKPPPGFLFLCPAASFKTGPSSFRWPDIPAYWSLDPSGAERISMNEATQIGFPAIDLTTDIWTRSWDDSVYAGLRHFHQAKTFNPETPDVARHLGYPLYQLSSKVDPPFAHVEEAWDSDEAESAMDVDIDELDSDSGEEGDWDRMNLSW
ncbi:hypothetical protein MVEN_00113500 [Mycena venus]|uniref:Uncharacterized protein n=1 Tax=Mycena venus TaxID=2733690 RepID=A0A8H6ZA31_9AGAR|nr:hypothetical protein MVEN_00113500 [Mycena venus]